MESLWRRRATHRLPRAAARRRRWRATPAGGHACCRASRRVRHPPHLCSPPRPRLSRHPWQWMGCDPSVVRRCSSLALHQCVRRCRGHPMFMQRGRVPSVRCLRCPAVHDTHAAAAAAAHPACIAAAFGSWSEAEGVWGRGEWGGQWAAHGHGLSIVAARPRHGASRTRQPRRQCNGGHTVGSTRRESREVGRPGHAT
jgi:hypothetical protein